MIQNRPREKHRTNKTASHIASSTDVAWIYACALCVSVEFRLAQAAVVNLDAMQLASIFAECAEDFDKSRKLRKRALAKQTLVVDCNGCNHVPPSLLNLRENVDIVRAYTSCMAKKGIICTNRIDPLKPPIEAYYQSMGVDVKSDHAKSIIHGTAYILKRMLHVVKKKWSRWEIPRAAWLL